MSNTTENPDITRREQESSQLKAQQEAGDRTATVTTFKESGKYNTIHAWRVPADAIGPWDMKHSPDFSLPAGWTVLVDADAAPEFPGAVNWGFPCLLHGE
jgi:hypothetical protein